MSDTNYKPLIMEKLTQLSAKCPGYSFGEILYSVFAHQSEEINITDKSDFLEITDQEIYSGLDRALIIEPEED